MEDAVGFIIAEVGRLRADLEIALAKATVGDPEREVKIKAWEAWALEDAADSDLYDDCFVLERHEIENAVALMRSADGKALLRELRAEVEADYEGDMWHYSKILRAIDRRLSDPKPAPVEQPAPTPDDERRAMIGMARQFRETYYPHSAVMHASGDDGQELLIYTRGEYRNDLVRLIASFGNMTGSAPVEKPAAAVTDHVPDAGKMVPVLYWLEDGKFARAMLVGKDLLVVDLTFGDGPSVVGKPEWFDAGYVATYGGLVPESATQGKEPGQWDYGVASIVKPAAAVPDDIGLGPVTGEMVQSGIAAVKDGRWITLEQLRKELAPVPDDPRWELVAQLGHFVCMMLKGEANRAEVRDIIAKMRGGA